MDIFTIIKVAGVSLALYIFYKFIILALLRLNFYKKQGLITQFSPLLGSFIINLQMGLKKHDDALYDLKILAQEKPNLKALVRNFGASPVVILLDPAIKKEFAFNHHNYEVGNLLGDFGRVYVTGLVGAEGEEWKKQRKIISQSFHFEFLRDNVTLMVDTTRELLKDLSKKNLTGIKILPEMEKIAAENTGKIFFSESLKDYSIKGESVSSQVMTNFENIGKALMSVGYLFFGGKYIDKGLWKSHRELIQGINDMENTCRKILEDRRKKTDIKTKDLAWYLLESQKNQVEEDRLSDDIIVANYVTFITAGTGTTSFLVTMTIYALAVHPEMLIRLKEEIRDIYDKEAYVSLDSLNKMNWLTALLKETLRMYSSASLGPTFKTATKDHQLGDITIKKGSQVGNAFVFSNFHSKYFENPFEYQPQRWIEKSTPSDPYAYTPFWAGPRNCIGQHLAMIEAKIMVCEFVKKFEFRLIKDFKLRMEYMKGYGPKDGMTMNLSHLEETVNQ